MSKKKNGNMDKALNLASRGEVEEAFSLISELESEVKGKKEYLTAKLYFKAGNFQKGVENLEEAVKLNSEFALFWEKIGDDLILVNQVEDALKAYERVYINIPQNSNILLKIGECHIALNEPKRAIEVFESFVTINGESDIASKRISKAKSML